MSCPKLVSISLLLLFLVKAANAQQLSLGNTPAMVNKSAVLELNATKQGLLLPRLSDTVAINALTPPDGMVIYFTVTKQFLLRANGYWMPLAAAGSLSNYWSTTGNSNGAIKKLGNLDNYDLPFVTNNAERMRLTTSGYLGIGTASPSSLLHVSGTNPLTLNGVQTGGTTTSDSLLTINNGIVQKLPVTTFQPLINGTGFVKTSGTSISYDNNTYTIANAAITGSTKTKITYDAKGLVTEGTNLIASDIPDLSATYQPLNGSLSSISGLAGTSGYLKKTAGNTYVLDNSSFLTTESDPVVKAINGLVKSNGTTIAAAVAGTDYVAPNATITGATKTKITYDSKGLVTTGADATTTDIAEGSNLYYTDTRVRATPLTGLSTATATAVVATDNLLAGVGKLQGQINTINSAGYLTGNQTINWTAGGDATGSASGTTSISPSLTITGLRGAALPALSTGLLKYNGSAWAFDNSSYLTSETSTLAAVTGRGNATATGISLIQNGNVASSFALYMKRNSDLSPLGNLIQLQNAAATTDLFKVDVNGNTTANSFIKTGGTSSQFLKADGSIDNTSYLSGNQSITLSGDVSGTGTTAITTSIGANKVTLTHMAQVANGTFLGRTSAGAGNVEALTTAQAKTLLGIGGSNSGDVTLSGQNYLSLSGQTITANPIDLSGTHATGTLAAGRFGALTGDVTNAAGSYATTITNGAVTYSKMQNISTNNRLLGRATTGAGSAEEITLGSGLSISGTTLSATGAGQWSATGNSGTTWNNNFIGSTDNVGFRIRTNNLERLVIDSLGNVGIANTIPVEKLDVAGNLRFSGALMPAGVSGTTGYVLQSNGAGAAPTWVNPSTSITNSAWLQNGNPVTSAKTIGTTSAFELPFITNNIERMRIAADGRVGIGITAPANNLAVKDTIEIRRVGAISTLLFSNTAGTGDFRITGDGGDIFWQGGGSRSLQMGAYWGMVLGGDRQSSTLPAFSAGSGGIGVLIPSQRTASVPLVMQAAGGQTANLTEWRNSSNAVLNAISSGGNLGIGTSSPSAKLHVVGNNPLTLLGVQNGGTTTADSVLTINSGIVQKLPVATFAMPSNSWNLTGNNTINWATHFLGATNNASLRFRTNNTERMILDSNGKLGVGNMAPSEVLDVAGNLKFSGALMPGGSAGTAGYILQSSGAGLAPAWANGTTLLAAGAWMQDGNTLTGVKKIGTISNHDLPFITNNTERMRIAANGYLGLGTASPVGRFHAVSDNSETGNDYLFDDYSNANTPGIFIRKARGTIASPLNLQSGDVIGAINFVPQFNGSLAYAPGSVMQANYTGSGTNNKSDLRFSTSGTEQIRIDESGNIGIGSSAFDVTSPEKLLLDAGTSTYTAMLAKGNINNYFQINIKNASTGAQSSSDLVATANNGTESTNFVDLGINGSGYVYQSGNPIETGKANDGYLLSSGSDFYIVNNNTSKDMIFLVGGTAPTNEAMRITSTETVGIGTTTPNSSTKLDVNGAVKIGTAGTVVKNMVTATATFASNTTIGAANLTSIVNSFTPTSYDVTYTLPAANTLASAQAAVTVSPGSDLPTGVVIAFARATSTTTLKVRFINSSTSSQTILSGTKLYFSITDF